MHLRSVDDEYEHLESTLPQRARQEGGPDEAAADTTDCGAGLGGGDRRRGNPRGEPREGNHETPPGSAQDATRAAGRAGPAGGDDDEGTGERRPGAAMGAASRDSSSPPSPDRYPCSAFSPRFVPPPPASPPWKGRAEETGSPVRRGPVWLGVTKEGLSGDAGEGIPEEKGSREAARWPGGGVDPAGEEEDVAGGGEAAGADGDTPRKAYETRRHAVGRRAATPGRGSHGEATSADGRSAPGSPGGDGRGGGGEGFLPISEAIFGGPDHRGFWGGDGGEISVGPDGGKRDPELLFGDGGGSGCGGGGGGVWGFHPEAWRRASVADGLQGPEAPLGGDDVSFLFARMEEVGR